MKQFFHRNGLSITMFGLFFLLLAGQAIAGFLDYNQSQQAHQAVEIGFLSYLGTGHFVEAVFENWESEFLQMGSYIFLTVFLFQKGSAESKRLSGYEPVDAEPRGRARWNTPWPVRRGGLWLKLYENSLGLAFVLLFIMSIFLHATGGAHEACRENSFHGEECQGTLAYMGTATFWFESFQNWQSEFLAVGLIIVLSIYLRQKGSPESKPVASPNQHTGE